MTYPTAEIRKFIVDLFDDDDLDVLCFDNFPEAANEFGSGMSKSEKVLRLLEYCQNHDLYPKLLAALKAARPELYEQRLGSLIASASSQAGAAEVGTAQAGAAEAGAAGHETAQPPSSVLAQFVQRNARPVQVAVLAGLLVIAVAVTLLLARTSSPASPAATTAPDPAATSEPSPTLNPSPSASPAPSASPSPTIPPTLTPTPLPQPTPLPTDAPPPDFTLLQPLHFREQGDAQLQPDATITDSAHLLHMMEVAYVQLEPGHFAYRVRLAVSNPTSDTIRLALKPDFFGLEDTLGREANQTYFCCSKPVDLLPAGQEREVLLFFEDNQRWGSGGKGGPDHLFFVVKGLLPVIRMSWIVQLLATAD